MVKVYKSREVVYTIEKVAPIITNTCIVKEDNTELLKEKERIADEIIRKAYCDAKRIISDADTEAEKYIQEAKNKANDIFLKAKAEGYETGYKESDGLIRKAEKKADQIVKEANYEREKIMSSLSNEILDLSFSIAEKIVNYELERNPAAFISLIHSAVSKVDDENAKVMVSEEEYINNYAVLSEDKRILPDNSLKKGEFRVHSKKGIVDASVSKQLAKAKLVAGVGN